MNLISLCGKSVDILTTSGKFFSGNITDYFYPEDNDSEYDSIVMETNAGDLIEFSADTIEKIMVIV